MLSLSSLPDEHPKFPMSITAGVTGESCDRSWHCTRMGMPHPNEAVLQKETPISLQGSGSLGNNLTKSICYIPTLGKTI